MRKLVLFTLALMPFSTTLSAKNFCDKYDCEGLAEDIIAQDSRSWFINRYDHGSVEVIEKSVWESPSGLKVKYKVNYTYNGGRSGWAELQLKDGEFYCIRYHDFPNDCRTGPKR